MEQLKIKLDKTKVRRLKLLQTDFKTIRNKDLFLQICMQESVKIMACSLASLYHKNFIDHQLPSCHCDAAFILFFYFFFLINSKLFCPLLSRNTAQDFFSRTGHFRGCWKSFSPLGKQSTLRTDSFSAPAPTITPAPTTEDFHPPPLSSPLLPPSLTSFFLCTTQTPTQKKKKKKKKSPAFSTLYHPISLYTGPCRPVSSVKHPQSPLLFFPFCLLYCNHFAGPETCGCAGSGTKKREAERKRSYMGTELRLNIYQKKPSGVAMSVQRGLALFL